MSHSETTYNTSGDFVAGSKNTTYNYITADEQPTYWVNVPGLPPHFMGRDEILTELILKLTSGETLALSAEGKGGVGKTSLAVAVARHRATLHHFTDGVLWAGAGPLANVPTILAQWAEALGRDISNLVHLHERSAVVKQLIGQKRLLLVLDDVWESEDAQALNCAGPYCVTLMTTREGEISRRFVSVAANSHTIPELADDPAFELLQALAPEACQTDEPAARRLVQAVGGLPLAIELIGGYLNEEGGDDTLFADLSQEALHTMADPQERLKLTVKRLGSHDGPVSLQTTISLSLNTLPTEAREAFYALGAFAPKPAAFTRAAAEAVTGASGKTLLTLVRRHLLERTADGQALTMHQTLTDVARTQLPEATVDRHRDFYVALANRDRDDWQTIETIYEQLEAAWIKTNNTQSCLDVIYASRIYQIRRGLGNDQMSWTEKGLIYAEGKDTWRKDYGILLNNISQIYGARGDYDTALSYLQQSLAIRQQIGDKSGEGTTLNNISQIYHARGDTNTALSYLQQSLAIQQQIGDKYGEGTTLNNISQIYDARGDYDTALSYLQQSLAIQQQIGDKSGEGTTLNNMATAAHARGDYDTALSYLQQSLA
ncbi:MAG: tetratricopeptide repeat protein, partial [Anaerolineales bacterium]|nr:tetratricopeptide repeat protein [Anaerolineales bacterium]